MTTATIPSSHRALLEAPGFAVLTTVGGYGRPQSTATWYLLDGDVVCTSMALTRQKYRNLLARPVATLFIFDPANPFRTLEVRGDAALVEDADLTFFKRLWGHYGQDPADHVGSVPDLLDPKAVLTLTPRHVVATG